MGLQCEEAQRHRERQDVEQVRKPVAGVCDWWSDHEFAADSSQSPSDVNAIMTASIQYCERVAVRLSLNVTSARSWARMSPATCPKTSAPTWTYQMPVAEIQA